MKNSEVKENSYFYDLNIWWPLMTQKIVKEKQIGRNYLVSQKNLKK